MFHTQTEEELRKESKHLLYEIQQMRSKAEILGQLKLGRIDSPEWLLHSVFESFLIHARLLYEFLFRPKGTSGFSATSFICEYVTPENVFLENWAWDMTSRRLFHLTSKRERLGNEDHKWDISRIVAELHKGLAIFYDNVSDEFFCEGLQMDKKELLGSKSEGDYAVSPVQITIDTGDPDFGLHFD